MQNDGQGIVEQRTTPTMPTASSGSQDVCALDRADEINSMIDTFLVEDNEEKAILAVETLCDPEDNTEVSEEEFMHILVTWKGASEGANKVRLHLQSE